MFTSNLLSDSAASSGGNSSVIDSLVLQSGHQTVAVTHDGFSIGASRQCDLRMSGDAMRPLHSLIHMQSGAIWIEAADDDTVLIVNDCPCRRMALRDGDRLTIGETVFVIQIGEPGIDLSVEDLVHDRVSEDLSGLTAEELCDRIAAEQTMVSELAGDEQSGWEALLHAIEAVDEEPEISRFVDERPVPDVLDTVAFDALLGEIRQLNDTIEGRSRELNAREAEVMASAAQLEESGQEVSQRIDEILDQLSKTEAPAEFRASA